MANAKPKVALQCCEIFYSSNLLPNSIHPSRSLLDSMERVLPRCRTLRQELMDDMYCRPSTSLESHGMVYYAPMEDDDISNPWRNAMEQIPEPKKYEYVRILDKTENRIQELLVNSYRLAKERRRKHSRCKIDLEVMYPSTEVKDSRKKCCKAPMTLLNEGRKELNRLSEELIATHIGIKDETASSNTNIKMLEVLTNLRKEFETCSTLLGAFMESQVQIPLEKAGGDKYVSKFAKHANSIGLSVWGFLILPFEYLNRHIMSNLSEDFRRFVVEFSRCISGVRNLLFRSSEHEFPDYDQRLEFLVGSMKKSVTCNQRYVSYSLERQLQDQCKKRNILHNTPVHEILTQWNDNFEDETLTLVPNEYRDLVARWIKWSLMINNLRESLASQTAIGVIGLVNSGKSKFVRSFFGKEVSEKLEILQKYFIFNDLLYF